MQFTLKLAGTTPDIGLIEDALRQVDPSAIVDIDSASDSLRVATSIESGELAALISQAGTAVVERDFERVPSVCCGGCGG